MAGKIKNCPMCGKLFNDTGKKVCPDCYQQILDKEHEVVEYVRDHKGAKIPEICEATGAPSGMIKKMIREGRFEQIGVKMTYPCEKCGAPIISTDHETGAREILAPDTDYHRKTYDKIDEAQYGILVPVCDGEFRNVDLPLTMEEQLMADAICRLINNPELAEHYRTEVLIRAGQLDLSKIAEYWVQVIEN